MDVDTHIYVCMYVPVYLYDKPMYIHMYILVYFLCIFVVVTVTDVDEMCEHSYEV